MFNAIWGAESSKTDTINKVIKEGLTVLATQLEQLQLQTASTENIVQKLKAALNRKQDSVVSNV